MLAKKKNKTTELIISFGVEMIDTRFRVKVSSMDNGVDPESFLVATQDLLEGGFSMKFFRTKYEVALFLNLLKMATK